MCALGLEMHKSNIGFLGWGVFLKVLAFQVNWTMKSNSVAVIGL